MSDNVRDMLQYCGWGLLLPLLPLALLGVIVKCVIKLQRPLPCATY